MADAPKKIGTFKWVILYGLTGITDILQFVADLTGVGVVVSEAAEPFIGGILVALLQLFGAQVITKPRRLGSLLAALGLDAITGGIAPFWILDIFYIHMDVRREQRARLADAEEASLLEASPRQPLYIADEEGNMVRRPPVATRPGTLAPKNRGAIRPAAGIRPSSK